MTRADLDAFQANAERFFAWAESEGYERQANVAAQLKVCVAELRAARPAVGYLRRLAADEPDHRRAAGMIVAAYDQAVSR